MSFNALLVEKSEDGKISAGVTTLDEDRLPIPGTELRVPLTRGARFVVDTQRLWHVVVHNGDSPRYALITSVECTPELQDWIETQVPQPASV